LRICRKPKFEHVKNWLKAFRFFYNYVFTNEEIGSAPLSNDQLPEWIKPILLIHKETSYELKLTAPIINRKRLKRERQL